MVVHTVGHSNLPFDDFVASLQRHGVELLVDVRSTPRSRFAPWSTAPRVADRLAERGTAYGHLGGPLGGRPPARAAPAAGLAERRLAYVSLGGPLGGRPPGVAAPDYDAMAVDPAYLAAIDDLVALAADRRIAIMCSEGDPLKCHREHLVGRTLRERGIEVRHILRRGELA